MSQDALQEPRGTLPIWLRGACIYLGVMLAGNLVWEVVQLPLYTIWTTGTFGEQVFAVVHCTLGDLLIAAGALLLALIVLGSACWPRQRFAQVAGLAILLGLGYTACSEWFNVAVRASWSYSERMPTLTLFGFALGLSPLAQWLAVPAVALAITRYLVARG